MVIGIVAYRQLQKQMKASIEQISERFIKSEMNLIMVKFLETREQLKLNLVERIFYNYVVPKVMEMKSLKYPLQRNQVKNMLA